MARTQWLLCAALFLGSFFFNQPQEYDNTKSRYMLLSAVVDEGRLSIDSLESSTIDKAFWQGHYYSNKAIGLPLLSVPVYWLLRRWVLGPAARVPGARLLDDPASLYMVRTFAVSLPFVLLGLLLFRFLLAFRVPARHALWAVLSYAFGTIALNHATIYSGHETAAFFLFSSFSILFQISRAGASAGGRSTALSFLAGLCAGCAVLCDYIAVFAALVMTWYALKKGPSLSSRAGFVAGAVLCAGVLAWYNFACFGAVSSLSYSHNWFPTFSQGASSGVYGISWPDPMAVLALLGSVSRGLFFISPVLVLCIPGLIFLSRRPQYALETRAILCATTLTLLANAGFYGWHGGWTFGPRYLVPVLPFLIAPLALTADGGPWFLVLFALSVFQVGCAQIGWPHAGQDIRNPIAEFILPLMREGGTAQSFLGAARPGAWAAGLGQYLVIGILTAMAFQGLPRSRPRRLPWQWKTLFGAWAAIVLGVLLIARTADQRVVHLFRGIVLEDTAATLGSAQLDLAGRRERGLAGALGAKAR